MSRVREIVKAAGGPILVARESQDTERPVTFEAVFKWYRNGIPDTHWPLMMKLASVGIEDLYSANREVSTPRPRKPVRRRRPKRRAEARPGAIA